MGAQRIRDIFIRLVFYWRRRETESEANGEEGGRSAGSAKAMEGKPKRKQVGGHLACVSATISFLLGVPSLANHEARISRPMCALNISISLLLIVYEMYRLFSANVFILS